MGANQTKPHIYAVPVSEKQPGETQIYRNVRGQKQLLDFPSKDIQTIQAVIEHAHMKFKDRPFVGKRDPTTNQFTYKTYSEEYRDARGVGSSIQKLYLTHNTSEYKNIGVKLIGIYAKNRVEWNTVDMACALYGFTLIPLYDTLGSETISYIFGQTQLTSCFCSAASIKNILSTQDLQKLVNIISFDPVDEETKQQVQQRGLNLMYYNDLVVQGTAHLLDLPNDVSPNTIFTFSYTSGTTGLPKGAMLSHKNFISIIPSLGEIDINENDSQLCYLPLPHVLQRIFNVVCWYTGTKIAFFGGDILKLKDDIQDSKPTLFVSVPRLFNKFYDVIQDNLKKVQGCKSSLIQTAIKTKLENLKTKNQLTHFLYDKLIFNKLKDVFGGKIRIVASGSAPISQEVLDFFKIVLQCPVYEGYGQTEGTGFQFCTSKYDMNSSGYVGGVGPQLEMKLIDVPEMNYFSTDKNEKGENIPRGEICVRGNSLFPGYYKDEEKTKEAIDNQGWLHSGDIGLLLPNGSLKIIDRRKNIFKLSQGEYVAPEKVENIYIRARGVQEAFLFGDSLQNYCVAILVPNPDEIKKIAAELNENADQDISVLCQNQQIIKFYQKNVFDHGKANKLFTFEQATKVHLEPKSFILLGLCTSTLKLQRHQAKQHYKQIIDQLYSQK
ncbi:hypothetical protein ABPG74_004641 [Tetrahymena malaccensis]